MKTFRKAKGHHGKIILDSLKKLYRLYSPANYALLWNGLLITSSLMNTSFSEYKDRATMSKSCLVSAWNSCFVTLSVSTAADVEHKAAEKAGGLIKGRWGKVKCRLKAGETADVHLRPCTSLQVDVKRVTFISVDLTWQS